MTVIYDVIVKHHTDSKPNTCLFYDDDREEAIEYMRKYVNNHGFTIDEKEGTYTIADLILRERESTGKTISETPYHELFDTIRGKSK